MKILQIPFFCLIVAFSGIRSLQAQTSEKISILLDGLEKPVKKEKEAAFVEERWQQNGEWKAKLYYVNGRELKAEYGYADSSRQTLHGTYTQYSHNHKKRKQVTYKMGKIDGPATYWLTDGTLVAKGMQTGEIIWGDVEVYNVSGKLSNVEHTDANGNGKGIHYLTQTGLQGEGAVSKGKAVGIWTYKDSSGKKQMEALYSDTGKLEKQTCFDANGNVLAGDCVVQKSAEFPGGSAAWLKFLQKNLKYPKESRVAEVQGIVSVKFLVKADGTIGQIKILDSPTYDLAAEALRVMELSPKWTPAIEANKAIPFYHIQDITFRLE